MAKKKRKKKTEWWYVYRATNFTKKAVYFGASKDPQRRRDGSHYVGGTLALKNWNCERDSLRWQQLSRHYTQNKAHVKLLIDAGYLDGNYDLSAGDHVKGAYVGRITMKGYDFLDNVRDETIWNKTKEKIQKTTGTASIEIVKEVAAALVRSLIFGS